jgi:predicted permease
MIRNYFKIAWRNLAKNKVYSLINIGGLAIGLACCLTIGLFIWDEYSYDRFHKKGNDIYRIVERQNQAGEFYKVAVTPGLLAARVKNDFPEIIQTCRMGQRSGILVNGKNTLETASIFVTDNSFFSLFDFKLIAGDPRKILLSADEIVISEDMAEHFFGKNWRQSNWFGQTFMFNNAIALKLTGVVKNPPSNSHIQYDILLSCRLDEAKENSWDSNAYHTYIQINPKANTSDLSSKLYKYLDQFTTGSRTTLSLQPLHNIYLFSNFDFHTDWSKTSNILYIRIFLIVGLIVLVIAVFNFINLATARAIQRAKEVGIRKVIGAFRHQLVFQFMGESFLMTLIAVVCGLLLLVAFLPLLNNIADKSLVVPFNEPYFLFSVAGFAVIVSLLAGIYPAFYLSNFRPIKVLKGIFSVRSGQFFRRTLVVSQFTLSIILVIGAIVIYKQLTFLQHKNLGFDRSQLLYVRMKNELRGPKEWLLKNDLQKQNSIAGVAASSSSMIDIVSSTYAIKWEGQKLDDKFVITQINIDPDFLPVTGMSLVAGRNFNAGIITDSNAAYLINETAARRMGWTPEQAIGKTASLWNREGKVIGVVNDFHFKPLTAAIEPFMFYYWPTSRRPYSYLMVKTKPGQVAQSISAIEKLYKNYERQTAPQYEFVNEGLDKQYRAEQRTGRIVLYFSILAIMVSCLGLFGLATFTASQRIKEIGVRKVLGASVSGIAALLSKDFLKLVMIAIIIASPVAWYAMDRWLENFAYRVTIEWWVFMSAGVIALLIAGLTVSSQAIRAAVANPVKSLRTE